MTPLEISIILHYYVKVNDFRNGDFSAPAVRDAIDQMRDETELLRSSDDSDKERPTRCYHLTERGRVYVEALQNVPLPVQIWQMPA